MCLKDKFDKFDKIQNLISVSTILSLTLFKLNQTLSHRWIDPDYIFYCFLFAYDYDTRVTHLTELVANYNKRKKSNSISRDV